MDQDGPVGYDALTVSALTEGTSHLDVQLEQLEHLEHPDDFPLPSDFDMASPVTSRGAGPGRPADSEQSEQQQAGPRYQRHYKNASVLICSIPVRLCQAA